VVSLNSKWNLDIYKARKKIWDKSRVNLEKSEANLGQIWSKSGANLGKCGINLEQIWEKSGRNL
jgi:hypothetical protein